MVVLLLSPRKDDPALSAFAAFLRSRGVPHESCSDLRRLRFSVELDGAGAAKTRFKLPEHGEVRAGDLGIVARAPWGWQAASNSGESRFVSTEYHAALWTLCALAPRVVNRPGRWAWLHEREMRYILPATAFVPEYWSTDLDALLESWRDSGARQAHLEDLLSGERWVLDSSASPPVEIGSHRRSAQLRALFAPDTRYLIQVCVGESVVTVVNETRADLESPSHRSLLASAAASLADNGVHLYALVMVAVDDGSARVVRVLTEPPWAWYAAHADEVHEHLLALLEPPK